MKKFTTAKAKEMLEIQLAKDENELSSATKEQIYDALAKICLTEMLAKKQAIDNSKKSKGKMLHYLSIEFLLGKSLKNNLFNLGFEGSFKKVLKGEGIDIDEIYDIEHDAGLGNGGLGRLAACYLDSLTTKGYSSYGHCILYEHGLFKQKVFEKEQVELPDEWLSTGKVWLIPREEESVVIRFEGKVHESMDSEGKFVYHYEDTTDVVALPYDMLISGYKSEDVSVLRLWSAKSTICLDDYQIGSDEYEKALTKKEEIESISKVLYPADHVEKGKSLRLKQQYFLVSSALQTAIKQHLAKHKSITSLPKYLTLHINDTHPAIIIPELMRVLLDDYRMTWDDAWGITTKVVNYTNHTILQESLEVWAFDLIERRLPRIAMILREIDRRFRNKLYELYPYDHEKVEKLAIISKNNLRMANLSVVAAKNVNGVAKVHSEILKNSIFREFYEMYPTKFLNVTNGISFRRWIAECNPKLDKLIQDEVGGDYLLNSKLLSKFKDIEKDSKKVKNVIKVKEENKRKLADYLNKSLNMNIDPKSRFDVQVKRIHEYKRQLLNVLKIIYLYSQLLENPNLDMSPQTFIFAGKSAPSYAMAKRIIHLILCLSADIEKHPEIAKKLKVVFVEDYSITLAELIMPATDVTEQISLAGREASGTGNMKAVLNGALMLCTEDGANIEICDKCGRNNHFTFGLTCDQVENIWKHGYNPMKYYEQDERIQIVIKKLEQGFSGESFRDIADYLLWRGQIKDVYLNLADFDSYMKAYEQLDRTYKNRSEWAKMTIRSISSMGYFSSDRSIEQYISKIWKL